MAEVVTFIYNIIVSRLKITEPEIEKPDRLSVTYSVLKQKLSITSSRINVSEFNYSKGNEFSDKVSVFRSTLSQGLPIQVRYKGAPIGAATIKFSKDFVENIDPQMADTIKTIKANIKKDGQVNGSIEVMVFIVPKCEEPDAQTKLE